MDSLGSHVSERIRRRWGAKNSSAIILRAHTTNLLETHHLLLFGLLKNWKYPQPTSWTIMQSRGSSGKWFKLANKQRDHRQSPNPFARQHLSMISRLDQLNLASLKQNWEKIGDSGISWRVISRSRRNWGHDWNNDLWFSVQSVPWISFCILRNQKFVNEENCLSSHFALGHCELFRITQEEATYRQLHHWKSPKSLPVVE
jgi:hypothetical protein